MWVVRPFAARKRRLLVRDHDPTRDRGHPQPGGTPNGFPRALAIFDNWLTNHDRHPQNIQVGANAFRTARSDKLRPSRQRISGPPVQKMP
jgi:hypothetical protein